MRSRRTGRAKGRAKGGGKPQGKQRAEKRRATPREQGAGPSALTFELVGELRGLPFEVDFLRFSPEGSRLAAATWEGPAQLWSVGERRLLQTHQLERDRVLQGRRVVDLAFADDQTLLVASRYESKDVVAVWRSDTNATIELRGDAKMATAAFVPGGRYLITTDLEWQVRLWDLDRRSVVASRVWEGGKKTVLGLRWRHDAVAVSPDACYLALCCDADRKIMQLWQVDAETPRFDVLQVLPNLPRISYLHFSPGSRLLALGVEEAFPPVRVDVRSVPEMALVEQARLPPPPADPLQDGILDVAFSPDERYLALSGEENKVWIYSRHEHRLIASFEAATRVPSPDHQFWSVRAVAWSPDGRLLATGGYSPAGDYWTDFTVRLWKLRGHRPRHRD